MNKTLRVSQLSVRRSIESLLKDANVPWLAGKAVAAYQNAELLRQRPWMWRTLHRLHPSLPYGLSPIGNILIGIGFWLALTSALFVSSSTIEMGVGGFILGCLGMWTGFICVKQYFRGQRLRWEWSTLADYEERHGRMPARAYELIGAIRQVTSEGIFRVKVVGDDPILNFGYPREEFVPHDMKDILIWGADKNIVQLPA